MTEKDFAKRINSMGGRLFIVGGWVRDKLRGKQPKDKDYVVTGITGQAFQDAFSDAGAKLIGKSFPVFLVPIDGVKCEVAFARKERKTGPGYKGFSVSSDAAITIEEDLYRRDTTMNSLALELLPEWDCDENNRYSPINKIQSESSQPMGEEENQQKVMLGCVAPDNMLPGRLIDLYGGCKDIEDGIIRPISEHFCEDPVRALRAARQAAQTGFELSPEVIKMMGKCREELQLEPGERILNEMKRALLTEKPSVFFRGLQAAGLLETTFPELFALIGQTQPEAFHPEGDSFEHVMLVVDKIAAQYAAVADLYNTNRSNDGTYSNARLQGDVMHTTVEQQDLSDKVAAYNEDDQFTGSGQNEYDSMVASKIITDGVKNYCESVKSFSAEAAINVARNDALVSMKEDKCIAEAYSKIADIDKDRITAVFCGLAHDLGKGLTPKEELPHHYGHENTGGGVLDAWNQRVTLPSYWLKPAHFLITNHMRAARMTRPGKILKFITEVYALKSDLSPFGVKAVIRADHGNNMPSYLAKMEELHAELMAVSGRAVPEGVKGKKVGEWLSQKRCHIITRRKMSPTS